MPPPDALVRPVRLGGRPLLVWIDRERTAAGYAFQVFDPERYEPQPLTLAQLAAAQAAVEEIMAGEQDEETARPLPPENGDEEDDAEQTGLVGDLDDDEEEPPTSA